MGANRIAGRLSGRKSEGKCLARSPHLVLPKVKAVKWYRHRRGKVFLFCEGKQLHGFEYVALACLLEIRLLTSDKLKFKVIS